MDHENENTNPVDHETAEREFDRFAEAMDLDLDESLMDDSDRAAYKRQRSRMVRAIERGALVINQDGEAVYTPQNSRSKHREAITFHERTGASLMAMDRKKRGHDVAKTYAVMADMCRVHPDVFAGLAGTDGKVCEAIFAFLMD